MSTWMKFLEKCLKVVVLVIVFEQVTLHVRREDDRRAKAEAEQVVRDTSKHELEVETEENVKNVDTTKAVKFLWRTKIC